MKFKIRFADQIVGFFIILALVSIAFVILMLGRSQRWFAKDIPFSTILQSAGGLNKNMAVQYKGFTIGSIKNFYLNDNDNVEVIFTIQEEYSDRVRQGSLVEMMVSPIGLGNQFVFHAGRGELLAEGTLIPIVGSAEARELIRQGLAFVPQSDDSITAMVGRVSSILTQLDEALGVGSDTTEIGQIIGSIQKTLTGVEAIPETVNRMLESINAQLRPILANVNTIMDELNNPDGLLYSVLDTDKDVYTSLVNSLNSISAILDSLDKTVAIIPSQVPQLVGLITELRATLRTAEDVLTALTNNPLLRGGIPARAETRGRAPRNISF